MATGALIAKLRAYRRAKERLTKSRRELDCEIVRSIQSGEWKLDEVVEVCGFSETTIRAIMKSGNG